MLNCRSSWRPRWIVVGAVALAGCGLIGPSGPTVKVETLNGGPRTTLRPDSTTVRVLQGTVVLESTVGYGQPSYVVEATAVVDKGVLRVDAETEDANTIVIVEPWYIRYRLTVSGIDAGDYRLRLLWHNRFYPPVLQLRDLVDTLITVP